LFKVFEESFKIPLCYKKFIKMQTDNQGRKNQFVVGWEADWLIPQTPAPDSTPSLTYPFSPHDAPHEFLTVMYWTPLSVP
jgi:hypothetical protein